MNDFLDQSAEIGRLLHVTNSSTALADVKQRAVARRRLLVMPPFARTMPALFTAVLTLTIAIVAVSAAYHLLAPGPQGQQPGASRVGGTPSPSRSAGSSTPSAGGIVGSTARPLPTGPVSLPTSNPVPPRASQAPLPAPPPARTSITLANADNRTTRAAQPGWTVVVNLTGIANCPWTIPDSTGSSLVRTGGSQSSDGSATATFTVASNGQVTLRASQVCNGGPGPGFPPPPSWSVVINS